MLREVSHLHARPEGDVPRVGFRFSGDELEQRGLSRTVHAHDAPPFASSDQEIEPVVNLACAVGLDDVIELRDVVARARRLAELELERTFRRFGGSTFSIFSRLLHAAMTEPAPRGSLAP